MKNLLTLVQELNSLWYINGSSVNVDQTINGYLLQYPTFDNEVAVTEIDTGKMFKLPLVLSDDGEMLVINNIDIPAVRRLLGK